MIIIIIADDVLEPLGHLVQKSMYGSGSISQHMLGIDLPPPLLGLLAISSAPSNQHKACQPCRPAGAGLAEQAFC